jgi:hypothetical protein
MGEQNERRTARADAGERLLADLLPLVPEAQAVLATITPGMVVEIHPPAP